jgi:SHS2 domain-containing protein
VSEVGYRWVDHTGELELELLAATEEGVFEDGLAAMRELMECELRGRPTLRPMTLEARDRATLLATWLEELALLAELHGLVPERLGSLVLRDSSLEAVVETRHGDPAHLVKGVSYHRLRFEPAPEGGWRATVVLDV